MICEEKDGLLFLWEIVEFCRKNGYDILFINITEKFHNLLKMAGFGVIKYGEDACFNLTDYTLAGGRAAKVRAAINHATKEGIEVWEYEPLKGKDLLLEKQMQSITDEWLVKKGGMEMGFMLGGMGLHEPMDRRYFYALDREGNMLGFVVFLPYMQGKAYLADITRRRNNAPQGVLEKIIFEGFMKMKEEGVLWGNMGLSPLYNLSREQNSSLTEKLFSLIYENMNKTYDFQALHHAKSKYGPTDWQARYLAFSPRPFSLNFGYAMLKVQMPRNMVKTILPNLLNLERK
jgi:phosphatidylglycerol lysyltransferase